MPFYVVTISVNLSGFITGMCHALARIYTHFINDDLLTYVNELTSVTDV
ncbi:TPA: hypothetical protein NJ726_000936 [Vibrio parahaemolyticus]|nr:hypothetical protein [Vibrio parahaemolyticus]HCG9721458.1 hypothetical protein [Vibrio parahaemolyticus]